MSDQPKDEPQTHDYLKPAWGRNCTFTPLEKGQRGHVTGWGRGVEVGDYLLLPNGNVSTRYRITILHNYDGPPDMWRAEVMFAPIARVLTVSLDQLCENELITCPRCNGSGHVLKGEG